MTKKMMLALVSSIIFAALLISVLAYPNLPQRMAIHWNSLGQVDGWANKSVGLFILPALMVPVTAVFVAVFLVISNTAKKTFAAYFGGFVILFNLFLLAVHGWTILWNLDVHIPANVFMPIAIACLFFLYRFFNQSR